MLRNISIDGYKGTVYKIYSVFIACAVYIMYPSLTFFELFKMDSTYALSTALLYASATLAASVKALILVVNRNKFRKILSRLEEKPFFPDRSRGGEEETKLLKKCVWITNIQTYSYCSTAVATFIVMSLNDIIARIKDSSYRKFAFGQLTPLDITDELNYKICWIYQSCCMCVYAFVVSLLDVLITGVLVHISYQFKILQNALREIADATNELRATDSNLQHSEGDIHFSPISWEYLQKTLKAAVDDYHVAILDISSEIETLFSKFMLVLFLESIVMGGTAIYQAPHVPFVESVGELLSITFHVVFYCYWGERVTEESLKVGLAAYEAYLPGMDLRFQKALVIIMRRSQTPTVITAAGFADIGLLTFATILRATYSALMVMRKITTVN